MKHYPTDLLLAVEQAELSLSAEQDGSLARLLDEVGLTGLAALILSTTVLPNAGAAGGVLEEFLRECARSVTVEAKVNPVSYTHLTLPTIYSV